MLKMPRKMAVLGAMLAALLITGAALAQQTPPHSFYGFGGSVTIDGEPAPSGTTIMAMAGGESVGSATYSAEGGWNIDNVPAGTMGVTFTVNGMAAEGSYDTSAGGSTMLSLAVTSATEESDELEDDGTGSGTTDGDGDVMDGGDGDVMDGGDGDVMDGGDGDTMDGGDGDSMDSGDSMDREEDSFEPVLSTTGTGGLADSSRGVSSAVYGGIAGALALIALAGGVAVRRRAQS